jgi:TorA maturation chaperone TorD
MQPIKESALTPQELAAIAQARASFCALLNVHFVTLPNVEFVQQIRSPEFDAMLEALGKDGTLPSDISQGTVCTRNYVQSTLAVDAVQLAENLGVDRTRLYRGVSPYYGPPPPYEAVWSKDATQITAVLQALSVLYQEAGVTLSPGLSERADYAGVELAYLLQLAQQELAAWKGGTKEQARGLVEKQLRFVRDHLGAWLPAFIERALAEAKTDFYRGHLLMLRGFLAQEQERLQIVLDELGG